MSADLSRIELAPREPLGSEVARRLLDHLLSGAVPLAAGSRPSASSPSRSG